jgi:transposase
MKRKQSHYDEAFKWRVVQEVLSGKFSKEEARRVYGISGNCTILYWMRKFSGEDDYRAGGDTLQTLTAMSQSKKEKALEERIKKLKQDLKREQLRADLWQKMVEVAEQELEIDIRKKFGAKQSQDLGQKKGKG